ncbi:hypothetical protein GCM10011399_06250 [Subtercola lobariae]|uniref:Uncharacterized protein n=1 Tax=Subtercola lobariae TaxID=1588641 RepID=A0A917EUU0_9MICO|nr:hypothetical protein GCM10011399_06250 [Subtercola lobariae]
MGSGSRNRFVRAAMPRASSRLGFVVENEQIAPGRKGQRTARVVPWCDVVCDGELASNLLDSLDPRNGVKGCDGISTLVR